MTSKKVTATSTVKKVEPVAKATEKKVEVKPAAKVAEKKVEAKPAAKVAEKKVEVKPVEKKVEVKATEKKAEAEIAKKKAETKPAAKKTTAKKATKKENNVYVQFQGMEFDTAAIEAAVKADYTAKNGKKTMSSVSIYIKPEANIFFHIKPQNRPDSMGNNAGIVLAVQLCIYVIDGIIGDVAL